MFGEQMNEPHREEQGEEGEMCEHAECSGKDRRTWGERGREQMGLCHADSCTEPLDKLPWCPGVRGMVLEAAGQGLQDQCSSLKLKRVSRQYKFLVSTEK